MTDITFTAQVFKVQNDGRDQEVGLELMRACTERLLVVRRHSGFGQVTATSCDGMGGIGGYAANLSVTLKDGRVLTKHIENAIGSLARPMSDADLEAKFSGLAEGVLSPARKRTVMDLCWKVETLTDAADIARATV